MDYFTVYYAGRRACFLALLAAMGLRELSFYDAIAEKRWAKQGLTRRGV